jgi:hypothetical protein
MLHIWYNQSMSDLLRVALPGFPDSLDPTYLAGAPPGWVDDTQQACIAHARAIGTVLRQADYHVDKSTFDFCDPSLPICVYESMRIQVQWLFMQRENTMPEKVEALNEDVKSMMSWVEGMPKTFRQTDWLVGACRLMSL